MTHATEHPTQRLSERSYKPVDPATLTLYNYLDGIDGMPTIEREQNEMRVIRNWLERRLYLRRAKKTYAPAAFAHIRTMPTGMYRVRH
jgi:arginine/ornithine N-succinyltransferase beta subunit